MAGSLNNGGRGGGKYRPMSEINVTPFVDVMLVLLIVFMVTAPLLNVGVDVDLPQSKAKPLAEERQPLTVTISAEGKLFLEEQEITRGVLVERLRAVADINQDTRIFVRGDKAIDYGTVMEVMGTINAAGYNRVALVTEPIKRLKGQ
jgi:biopolymer transport protein TolR